MGKKIIIAENHFKRLVSESFLTEAVMSDADIERKIKSTLGDTLKNDREINKAIEKKVKEMVANSVGTLFKTLWQRRNFYEDDIKNS